VTDSLDAALAHYSPHGSNERADVGRVRALVASGDPWPRSLPLHVTGSAVIVHRATRRVLLRWHARQNAWLQVGGHGDPGETDPLLVALREGAEETGLLDLVPWPTGRIVHVTIVPVPAARHEPAHEHADVRYVLATETPELATPESPGAALRWLPVEEAIAEIEEENLRETLRRVRQLFDST
jgi:8-oxo-dGTP pyrophosphatase MutT (NUDIX family)